MREVTETIQFILNGLGGIYVVQVQLVFTCPPVFVANSFELIVTSMTYYFKFQMSLWWVSTEVLDTKQSDLEVNGHRC